MIAAAPPPAVAKHCGVGAWRKCEGHTIHAWRAYRWRCHQGSRRFAKRSLDTRRLGKSGGARVIQFDLLDDGVVVLLTVYAKPVDDNLSHTFCTVCWRLRRNEMASGNPVDCQSVRDAGAEGAFFKPGTGRAAPPSRRRRLVGYCVIAAGFRTYRSRKECRKAPTTGSSHSSSGLRSRVRMWATTGMPALSGTSSFGSVISTLATNCAASHVQQAHHAESHTDARRGEDTVEQPRLARQQRNRGKRNGDLQQRGG